MLKNLFLITALVITQTLFSVHDFKVQQTWHHDQSTQKLIITLEYDLKKPQAILKNSVHFSVDTPSFRLVDWKSTEPAITVYDPAHSAESLAYTGSGAFIITLEPTTIKSMSDTAHLFMHYQEKTADTPQEFRYKFSTQASQNNHDMLQEKSHTVSKTKIPSKKEITHTQTHSIFDWFSKKLGTLNTIISHLVEKTNSPFLRLVTIYILGLLMSLTPCIYPMIPITVGILQTSTQASLFRNFLLAGSYTMGIATTFAVLGLLAASGGSAFGSIMGNIYFVLFLVTFLAYLAFSMLGFYDMYVPRFMQSSGNHKVNGSYLSAFAFGAISGSAASPCLSPGLGLVFTIVAALGSKLLGFVYLFMFGLGVGTPLLIIGTFSNALNVVPRAGLWMVEVKKLFGLLLLSMCFYYLANIMPWYALLWLIAGSLFVGGSWYIFTIESYYSTSMRWYKQIFGFILLLAGFLVSYQALKTTFEAPHAHEAFHTATNYDDAREKAIQENKYLIVDFGTLWCTSCKAIERKFLQNKQVRDVLDTNFIIVKIDCSNDKDECCVRTQEQFASHIKGFPTLLVVEPKEQIVLTRWGGELLNLSLEEFIELTHKTIAAQ